MRPAGTPSQPDIVPRRADWHDTRRRILQAAAQQFSKSGYRRTNTLELAEAAGVAEATVFRHFATKAELFEEAVVTPMRAAVAELAERRRQHPNDIPAEDAVHTFYDEILGWSRQNARLLTAALAALAFEQQNSEFSGVANAFTELLAYMDEVFRVRSAERGYTADPVITPRIMLAMTLGLALCDSMLFDDEQTPRHEDLVSELAKFTTYGVARPSSGRSD